MPDFEENSELESTTESTLEEVAPSKGAPTPSNRSASQPLTPEPAMQSLYESIYSMYPHIEEDIIQSITSHTLSPLKLWTLADSFCVCVAQHDYPVDFIRDHTQLFPNFRSLHVPLLIYFNILISFADISGDTDDSCALSTGTNLYMSSLAEMSNQFEWQYVLKYHLRYMKTRMNEMKRGYYRGWGPRDVELFLSKVVAYSKLEKSSSEVILYEQKLSRDYSPRDPDHQAVPKRKKQNRVDVGVARCERKGRDCSVFSHSLMSCFLLILLGLGFRIKQDSTLNRFMCLR
ncbi:hypothetical protein C8J55DRAFT_520664 [Lentinula edodes]|uniref:Uncharacterized protein n=1 Tax=Lentinula lateritia TaxID=40482 RepID=A0A9W9A0J4_9AGAR|nr:hypothetical protein C8J55DRAFT_520664 [Lentinula edodes]